MEKVPGHNMKYICLIAVSTVFLLQDVSGASANAPWKSWKFCKKPDPTKVSDCLIKAIQGVEKDIVDGSSYFGIPRLNPLHIEELSLSQAGQDNKAVAVNITFKNCDVAGLRTWKLTDAVADWDAGVLKGIMRFKDPITFTADYTVDGKIILLPVKGKGKCKIVFGDMDCPMHIKGHLTERKGKKYFTVDSFDMDMQPKSASFYFGDIFAGQTALSENINKVLNENWQEVMSDVKKPVAEGLGAAFKEISNRIFTKIPYETLVQQ